MIKLIAIILVIVLAVLFMLISVQIRKKKPNETLGEWNKRNKQV
jgi:uncharacterized protein YoxC